MFKRLLMITLLLPTMVCGAGDALTDSTITETIHEFLGKPISQLIAEDSKKDPRLLEYLGTTQRIEFKGNIFGERTSEFPPTFGCRFVYNSIAHFLNFFFNRLEDGPSDDNFFIYSCNVSCRGGGAKYIGLPVRQPNGERIDMEEHSLIISFNKDGEVNLFDYQFDGESDHFPKITIDTADGNTLTLELDFGQGKGKESWKNISSKPNAIGTFTSISKDDGGSRVDFRITNHCDSRTFTSRWYKGDS